MIGSAIDDAIANNVMAQILFLEGKDPDADIVIYINTLGGSVPAGLAIYDTMQYIKPDVQTWCLGQAYSMGQSCWPEVRPESGTRSLTRRRSFINPLPRGLAVKPPILASTLQKFCEFVRNCIRFLAAHTCQPIEKIQADRGPRFLHDFPRSA